MEILIAGGVLVSMAISAAVFKMIDFVRRKRKRRSRIDPSCNSLMESDLKLADQIREAIRKKFDGNVGQKLKEMSFEERKEKLEEIVNVIGHIIGVEGIEVEFLDSQVMGRVCGSYRFVNNKLQVNEEYIRISDIEILLDVLDTIIHETMHAYQGKKMLEVLEYLSEQQGERMQATPENIRTVEWIVNQESYIRYEVDPEGYRKQPVEWYAFAMANEVIRKL